jgi:hypothetical protein
MRWKLSDSSPNSQRIERLEGRRRFLDNRRFFHDYGHTTNSGPDGDRDHVGFDTMSMHSDGVDTAVGIVLGVIRVAIILVPIAILIILPAWLILRRFLRRLAWPRKQIPLAVTPAE